MTDGGGTQRARLGRHELLHYADGLGRVTGRTAAKLRVRIAWLASSPTAAADAAVEIALTADERALLRRIDEREAETLFRRQEPQSGQRPQR